MTGVYFYLYSTLLITASCCLVVIPLAIGTGGSSLGFMSCGIMLNGLGLIGLAICLLDWPSGDLTATIYLAFDSISIPIKLEIESMFSNSSLIFLS